MKRLTKAGLTVAIAGLVLLLKGSSPLVTSAIAQNQKNQLEMHPQTPHPTDGPQFARISPQKAKDQFRFCRRFLSWMPS